MIKMGAIGPLAYSVFEKAGEIFDYHQPATALLPRFALYLYAYPVFLYFNFSGYTDIAIGSAELLGCRLPENFNQPYLARSILDFWNRWHMSLTHWIRDYLFMTSYKAAAERFPAVAKYLGWVLLFFALFIAGIWHGSTPGYMVFGTINGFGAAVNQAYGDYLRHRLGRAGFQRYQKNRLVKVIAIVATFHYMCFSHLFFSSGVSLGWARFAATANELVHSPGASFYKCGPTAVALPALAGRFGGRPVVEGGDYCISESLRRMVDRENHLAIRIRSGEGDVGGCNSLGVLGLSAKRHGRRVYEVLRHGRRSPA
jgi:hypothetical protein